MTDAIAEIVRTYDTGTPVKVCVFSHTEYFVTRLDYRTMRHTKVGDFHICAEAMYFAGRLAHRIMHKKQKQQQQKRRLWKQMNSESR